MKEIDIKDLMEYEIQINGKYLIVYEVPMDSHFLYRPADDSSYIYTFFAKNVKAYYHLYKIEIDEQYGKGILRFIHQKSVQTDEDDISIKRREFIPL